LLSWFSGGSFVQEKLDRRNHLSALCNDWSKLTPLYYFDTSGYAFTYPFAWLFGCKVICYTPYPTISSDMPSRVRERSLMYNNDALITNKV